LFALLLAFLIDSLDRPGQGNLERMIPSVFLTRAELADSVLTAIATSLLTMTTITFSVMMVVLSTYASQYSPRTLPNFIKSKIMAHAQGIFFAGFTYSVASLLNLKRVVDLAMQEGLYLKLAPKVGQYVEKGSLLFEVWGSQDSAGLEPTLTKNVSLGLDRTNQQDLVYVMEKIIETGLRAISPSINDPNTAIYCIRELSLIIKRLGDWKGSHWIIKDRTGEPRMEIPFYSFEELLYKTYYQLRHYGAHDVSVSHALIEALIRVAEKLPSEGKQAVLKFGEYITHHIDKKVMHEFDKQLIDREMSKLQSMCGT
jgi:uncharacterized membrane protein